MAFVMEQIALILFRTSSFRGSFRHRLMKSTSSVLQFWIGGLLIFKRYYWRRELDDKLKFLLLGFGYGYYDWPLFRKLLRPKDIYVLLLKWIIIIREQITRRNYFYSRIFFTIIIYIILVWMDHHLKKRDWFAFFLFERNHFLDGLGQSWMLWLSLL